MQILTFISSRWPDIRIYTVSNMSSRSISRVSRSIWSSLVCWPPSRRLYHRGQDKSDFLFTPSVSDLCTNSKKFIFQINGISVIRAGHRQAVELIRSTTGTLRLTATSVVTPKKTSGEEFNSNWINIPSWILFGSNTGHKFPVLSLGIRNSRTLVSKLSKNYERMIYIINLAHVFRHVYPMFDFKIGSYLR